MEEDIPIEQLVPHAGPMMLLDALLESIEESIKCRVVVRSDGLFDSAGSVSAWIGLEYMAQTVAAFSGYKSRSRGEPAKIGLLLGARRFETDVSVLECGTILTVTATRKVQGSNGMAAFSCSVIGEGVSQAAILSVFEPADAHRFLSHSESGS